MRPLAARALEQYDLEVVRVRGLPDATNGVFRLDTADGGRFAMRVGLGPPAGHTVTEMESEAAWLDSLHEHASVVLPEVVRTRDGRAVVEETVPGVPHPRPCVIFTWLDGPLLADRISHDAFVAYGAAMADLHRAALAFVPPDGFVAPSYDRVYPYDLPFIVFEEAGDELLPANRRALFAEGYEVVDEEFTALCGREPMRMLHGDMHGWNVKLNRGRIAVFDFEDMVWGWPIQDIGVALYYYWRRDDFDDLVTAFRSGYETVLPWPDRGGELWTVLIARTLLMANDVISQPEWLDAAPQVYEVGEERVRDMLQRRQRA